MTYSCTSPTSTTEEDWINEVIAALAPLTKYNSGADSADGLFSTNSPGSTASYTTPEDARRLESPDHGELLLDSVSAKLLTLQKSNRLTPKSLESVFNTQDVLTGATCEWLAGLASLMSGHCKKSRSHLGKKLVSGKATPTLRKNSLGRRTPRCTRAKKGRGLARHSPEDLQPLGECLCDAPLLPVKTEHVENVAAPLAPFEFDALCLDPKCLYPMELFDVPADMGDDLLGMGFSQTDLFNEL